MKTVFKTIRSSLFENHPIHSLFVLCICMLLLGACSILPIPLSTPTVTSSPSPTPDAEMLAERVYTALVDTLYPTSALLVIMEQTQTSVIGLAEVATYQRVQESLKEMSAETLQNFRLENNELHTLRTSMVLGRKYILFSLKDRQELFRINQSGWDVFYNRYPDAPGIITFSKVGFNKTMDLALVYVGMQSNWLAGVGNFYLLQQVNGKWVIEAQVNSWIS